MFSPQQPPAENSLNPNRRRTRQTTSRPASRTAQRNARSGSEASGREASAAPRQRASGSPASGADITVAKRQPNIVPGKDLDGGVVDWTKNDKYRVSKLPAIPPIFKSCTANNTPVFATTDSVHGYALLLTHASAYVWKYTTPHTIPHTFSFPLPSEESTSSKNLPFPLGTLVNPSANSTEPGLVVVMPMTGLIAYWDSVGSAVAEGLFTKKRGVEGKVPIMSGEAVTAICAAEPAGFILSLSSGRLAHLALRDNAGRPGVNITIMRGNSPGGFGGLLGALRAGSTRRDVVAVRTGKMIRIGEREIIVGTARANFSRWHVNRSGAYANVADADMREVILSEIERSHLDVIHGRNKDQFVVIDMAVGNYKDSGSSDAEDELQALVLTAFIPTPDEDSALYVLVSVNFLPGGTATVGNVHAIKSCTSPLDPASRGRPRLYLPKPGKTAFVVFPRAVVVVSALGQIAVDDDQGMDIDYENSVFEDVVDFRGDLQIEVVGSGSEDVESDIQSNEVATSFTAQEQSTAQGRRSRNPGIILVAKGAGVVRVEAFDVDGLRKKAAAAPVTVKSKLEQAVFYGIKADNPLNFLGRKEVDYPIVEVEEAALEVSKEILGSRSTYMPALLPSLDAHLALRATHLRALVEHLKTGAFGKVSKTVYWQLLLDAEKCDAARAVWEVRNARMQNDPDGVDGVLENCINNYLPPDIGVIAGNDPVRTWFQRDIDRIGELLPIAKKGISSKSKGKKEQLELAHMDAEANDIVTGALMSAWTFRVRSAALYGLDGKDGINVNGRLRNSAGFVAPWTSEPELLQSLDDQYTLSHTVLQNVWSTKKMTQDAERLEVGGRIANQLAELAEICCRTFEERADWCEKQGMENDDLLQEAATVRERYETSRSSWIKPLVHLEKLEMAYEIAEKWHDYRTLVEICSEQLVQAEVALASNQDEETIDRIKADKAEITARLEDYFNTFGQNFAIDMYDFLVENGRLQQLLNGFEPWREQYLTPYLRKNPKYAKLAWIHDVSLGDYNRASETLFKVATTFEEDLRFRKIELSIGKLARLAAGLPEITHTSNEIRAYDINLELVNIQQKLFRAVNDIKKDAVDAEGAVQIAMDDLGRSLKRKPAFRELFRRYFKKLIQNHALDAEELVDLLTLAERSDGILGGEEFFWALKAIGLAGLGQMRLKAAERTIWRRCYLRDDWAAIASTRNKSDDTIQALARQTALYNTIRLGYERNLYADDSPFRPLSPEESKFPEDPSEVRARFQTADEVEIAGIAQELLAENKKIDGWIKKTQLENWFNGLVEDVKIEVEGVMVEDEEGDTIMA